MLYPPESIKAQLASLDHINQRLDTARYLLADKFTELSAFLCCMPFPAWIKGKDTRMIYVNRAYENVFGITAEQYNAKFDVEVWVGETAKAAASEYMANDFRVMEMKRPLKLVECAMLPDGTTEDFDVIKWGLLDDHGTIIGVAGICTSPLL